MIAHLLPGRRRQSGIAIVLVLSILILLTAVVVAFFTNATTDLTASKSYSDQTRVKLLANSAVNLVEGQIRAATVGVDANNSNSPLDWASQPGVIRTYDINGAVQGAYKLYSSDELQVTQSSDPDGEFPFSPNGATAIAKDAPANWNALPSDFVDLNSPTMMVDPAGTLTLASTPKINYSAHFPIIDGNNLAKGLTSNGSAVSGLSYDSNGDSVADIEGFSVIPPSSYNPNLATAYIPANAAYGNIAPGDNPVPMPVRWLYVLQDGELHPRNPSIPFAIPGASSANPVVGRVAFWTDDDTSKLNVNTASEGTFWDRPWAKTATEVAYSTNIPAQNEFQAFTGHPAKDCLSTVFGSIWPVPYWLTPANTNPPTASPYYSQLKPYYDLTPRVTESLTNGSAGATQPATQAKANGVQYDADRLYESVDELMFSTTSSSASPPARLTRNVVGNLPGTPKGALTPALLETTRFFLTASNRAPEVTLLNTPRIALWPLQYAPTPPDIKRLRTPKDQLLAFCSTIPSGSQNQYYFQRYSTSPQANTGSSYSPTMDFSPTLVPRNDQLYTYLQKLTNLPVPGLGGNFATKYGGTTNQILTEMVDQIRSGPNLFTSFLAQGVSSASYQYTDAGQVVPLVNPNSTNTQGFGRFTTITEAALDLFRCNYDPKKPDAPIQIGAVLILQPFNASPGYASLRRNLQIEVTGLDQFTIRNRSVPTSPTQPLGFLHDCINIEAATDGGIANGNLTENIGVISSFYDKNQRVKSITPMPAASAIDGNYPFVNNPSILPTGGNGTIPPTPGSGPTTFDLNPAGSVTITIQIYPNPKPPSGATALQTIQMNFPPAYDLPVPISTKSATTTVPPESAATYTPGQIFSARIIQSDGVPGDPLNNNGNGTMSPLVGQGDIVRSVVVDPAGPSKGDLRIIAALSNIPYTQGSASNYFHPHPFYHYRQRPGGPDPNLSPPAQWLDPNPNAANFNWQFAHSLRIGDNPGWGTFGWYDYGSTASQRNYLTPDYTGRQPARQSITRKSMYSGVLVNNPSLPSTNNGPPYAPEAFPTLPVGTQRAVLTGTDNQTHSGDWDNGVGALEDGCYISKPDESNSVPAISGGYAAANNATSIYFSRSPAGTEQGATYSPNREVSSAVMFGSLPTGINPGTTVGSTATVQPWQTLLFCANPPAGINHPGFGVSSKPLLNSPLPPAPPYQTIPDHYIMDLFTMPIVEPYALSEPLSSQGKVNMNYQIAPFTYIRRDTAVQAVLKATRMMAIPSDASALANYKSSQYRQQRTSLTSGYQYRYLINPDETSGTLAAFESRFNGNAVSAFPSPVVSTTQPGDLFRSASEICGVPLVPEPDPSPSNAQKYDPTASAQGVTADPTSLQAFWNNCRLTGDNTREEPYGDLYARLTTKSNAYTVHVRVQTLKKALGTSAATFIDPTDTTVGGPKDLVTAEYRGSYQIERYVDPNITSLNPNTVPTPLTETTNFPDYAGLVAGGTELSAIPPISNFYKFHTINTTQFQ